MNGLAKDFLKAICFVINKDLLILFNGINLLLIKCKVKNFIDMDDHLGIEKYVDL